MFSTWVSTSSSRNQVLQSDCTGSKYMFSKHLILVMPKLHVLRMYFVNSTCLTIVSHYDANMLHCGVAAVNENIGKCQICQQLHKAVPFKMFVQF
jgi:hypothetical protein